MRQTNPDRKIMMAPTDQDVLLDDIAACERRVWQALVDGDAQQDAALLCDGFLGVYSDGFAGKSDHTGQLDCGPTIAAYALEELHLTPLGPTHVAISYRARFQRVSQHAPEQMYVTSIWEKRSAGWINIFSQDTPALTPDTAPSHC